MSAILWLPGFSSWWLNNWVNFLKRLLIIPHDIYKPSDTISNGRWDLTAHSNGLMQEGRNSSAIAMELDLSCTNPSTECRMLLTSNVRNTIPMIHCQQPRLCSLPECLLDGDNFQTTGSIDWTRPELRGCILCDKSFYTVRRKDQVCGKSDFVSIFHIAMLYLSLGFSATIGNISCGIEKHILLIGWSVVHLSQLSPRVL